MEECADTWEASTQLHCGSFYAPMQAFAAALQYPQNSEVSYYNYIYINQFVRSSYYQNRDLRVRENLARLAAQQHCRQAFTTMRRHDDKIAAF